MSSEARTTGADERDAADTAVTGTEQSRLFDERCLVEAASRAYDLSTDTLVDLLSSPGWTWGPRAERSETLVGRPTGAQPPSTTAASLGMEVDKRYVMGTSFDKEKDAYGFHA